jgi:hypothetical protein
MFSFEKKEITISMDATGPKGGQQGGYHHIAVRTLLGIFIL